MAFPILTDATWVNPSSVTLDAGELRRADSAGFAGTGTAFGVLGGIVRHAETALQVTVDGSDQVTIQPGAVVIPGNAASSVGCYRTGLASTTGGHALAARNATNGRVDLIVYRQLDDDVVNTHDAYTARIDVVTGTPSATPVAPTLPSMAVELARVNVPASGGGAASVDLTYRTFACAVGGMLPVTTEARLPASVAKWQRAQTLDTGARYEHDGTSWVRDPQVATGTIAHTATGAAGTLQAIPVTLPTGRFAANPVPSVMANNANVTGCWASVTSPTAMTVYYRTSTNVAITLYWTATLAP